MNEVLRPAGFLRVPSKHLLVSKISLMVVLKKCPRCLQFLIFQWWHRGVVVITTAQLHSTKPELRFCAGLNPPRCISEIDDDEDL